MLSCVVRHVPVGVQSAGDMIGSRCWMQSAVKLNRSHLQTVQFKIDSKNKEKRRRRRWRLPLQQNHRGSH